MKKTKLNRRRRRSGPRSSCASVALSRALTGFVEDLVSESTNARDMSWDDEIESLAARLDEYSQENIALRARVVRLEDLFLNKSMGAVLGPGKKSK